MIRCSPGSRTAWGGVCFLALLASVLAATPSYPQPVGPDPGVGRLQRPLTPLERRDRLRMLRTWQMIVSLDLDEAQSQRFFLILKRFDAEEDRLNGERERLSRSLKDLVDRQGAGETAIQDTMKAIRRQEDLLREARGRYQGEAANILSLRQQAKMLLFERRFDMVLRNTILDVMMKRRGEGMGGWGFPPGAWAPPDRRGGGESGGGWDAPAK